MATNATNPTTAPAAPDASVQPVVSDIYPCLYYRDATAAIEWLERAFGFTKRLVVPGPDDTIVHGELSFGSSVVMAGTAKPEKGWVSPRDLPAVNQVICMYVADVDAHYARAVAAGAEIIGELRDTDYGARGYECHDLEGNVWCFGNYRPGAYWDK